MNRLNDDARERTAVAREGLAELFTLAALLGHAMDQGLAEHGLTRARGELITTLYHQGAMTQRQLSQALECSAANVTGLLDALETGGFVTREPHPTDRRATLATLTERGTALASGWSAEHDEFAAALFTDLATPELMSFVSDLNRVVTQLRKAVPTRAGDTGP